jgi:hypothetical protein
MLSSRFSTAELLTRAAEVDSGFDHAVFADMIGGLDRYSDTDLTLGGVDVAALRTFFSDWRSELHPTD